jgi:RNA polymerase sigma-70 factor (ECF subfamily)
MELRKDRTFLVPLQETAAAGIPDTEPDTEGLDAQTLVSLVRQLPPGYRAVFNLFVIEEKTHKEIAEILHIQPASSASQLSRAKQMLTKMIKAHHHKTGKR